MQYGDFMPFISLWQCQIIISLYDMPFRSDSLSIPSIAGCRYNMVQNNTILNTALQWLKQRTHFESTVDTQYSFVRIVAKIERVKRGISLYIDPGCYHRVQTCIHSTNSIRWVHFLLYIMLIFVSPIWFRYTEDIDLQLLWCSISFISVM